MMSENLSLDYLLDKVAAPVLICEDHTIVFANPAAENLIGKSRHQLLKINLDSLIYLTSTQAFSNWYHQRIALVGKESLDVRLNVSNNRLIWVRLTTESVTYEGHPAQVLTLQDITQVRQMETELYLSKAYRDMLMTNNSDVVVITDEVGTVNYVSPSVESALSFSANTVLDHRWTEWVHADDKKRVVQAFEDVRDHHKPITIELRIRNNAGDYIWFEVVIGLVYQIQDDQVNMISAARNINKYKLIEIALREREQRLRLITDNMSDIVIEINPDGITRYISPSCLSMLGYQPETLIGHSHMELVHEDDVAAVFEYFGKALVTPSTTPIEMRLKHIDGHYIWVELIHNLVMDDAGTVQSIVIALREISKRKQAQTELQKSQHLLQRILDTAPTSIYLYDQVVGKCIFYNQNGVLGYSDSDVQQANGQFFMKRVHPDDASTFEEDTNRLLTAKDGEVIICECRMKHANGDWRWFQYHDTVFMRDDTGKPTQLLRVGYDITERKRAEADLQHNQQMLQQITDVAPLGIYIYDVKQGRDIYHNQRHTDEPSTDKILIKPEHDFYEDFVHPDELTAHRKHQALLMAAKDGEIIESENRIRRRDGVYRWYYFRDTVFKRDEEGKPSQFLGSMQDITARKQADEALQQSQNMLKQITDTAPFGIYIYDVKERRDVYHNQRLVTDIDPPQIPNLPEGEFYESFVHPDDLALQAEHRKHLMEAKDGEIIESELRASARNGDYQWLYFRDIVFARDADGKPSQFLGSMQDITERKQAEQALRENQNLLKQITDTVPLDIYIYDVDLKRNVFFNRAQNMGYPVEVLDAQLSGDFFSNLVHPDDLERHRENAKRLATARDGELMHSEYRMKHASGAWHWYDFRDIVFARHADGTPRQFLGSVQDITDRKETEAALRQSQHRFQQVTETVPIQIYIYDYDLGHNIFENRPSDLGFDKEMLANASASFFTELIHPDDRPHHDEIMTKLLSAADGQMLENQFRMRNADDNYVWYNHRYIPFARRPDGSISQFLGAILNVDERIKVSDALRENEEKLRLITDNIHDMVSLADSSMHYSYVSPSHERVLGYKPNMMLNKSVFELVHPDDVEMVRSKLLTAIEKRQPDSFEFRVRHNDGYYVWLETTGALAIGDQGEFNGVIFASRDISERRWMQRAMLEQEKLLVMLQKEQELSQLKTRMMSRLSHELRTPLAVISTSADLLDLYGKRMTEAQRAERLQQIKGQVKHFTGMLDNISLVVKGISYSMDFAPAPYNLERTATSTITDLKELLRVQHEVKLDVQGDMNQVNSDEQLMRLILTHLLANAMKYSPATSPIVIRAALRDNTIVLSVQDQGIGILPDDRERIFEPFFRGTNIGEIPGLGVGLSIVKDAVDSMEGSIEVESEIDKGTTVTVKIPLGGVIGLNM